MYGGHRLGDNLFARASSCVEAATGKRVWHYQTCITISGTTNRPRRRSSWTSRSTADRSKRVVQITKQSYAYVLDRMTGKPVWPIVERAVPQSTVPGERTAPTQPIPTKPPPFDLQGATEEEPDRLHAAAASRSGRDLQALHDGPLFTPPSIRDDRPGGNLGTIELPGSGGGANWTGGAVRSRHRHSLCAVRHCAVRRRHRARRPDASRTCATSKARGCGARRAARLAAVQAAVRPHHARST